MRKIFFTLISFLSLLNTTLLSSKIEVGKNLSFKKIKDAIAIANLHDTIVVNGGVYKEGNITITKKLVLLGNNAILDGELKYEILTLSASGIVVSGFTFRNSGSSTMNDFASIKVVDAGGFVIEKNTILNSHFAIHISNCKNFIVRNNLIRGNPHEEQNTGNGIHLWKCDKASITANNIEGHRDGIYFEFVTNSQIVNNYSAYNIRYGLHFMFSNDDAYLFNRFIENGAGVAVMFSHNITMTNNLFTNNTGASAYGLLLKEISDGKISNNKFSDNTTGIFIEGSNRLDISSNHFLRNGFAMRMQASCNENIVKKNNFIANTFDVSTNGSLMLNKIELNYWDKYEGYDINKDGFGDIPFRPISLYSVIIENSPVASIFMRSFIVTIMDKTEKALPVIIPELVKDGTPVMLPYKP